MLRVASSLNPEAEPPESGSPTTGTCEVVETSTVSGDDPHGAPNDIAFQSIYWYDPSGWNIQLYTCLNDYLVINTVEIADPKTSV